MTTRTGAAADLQKRTGSLATVLLARTARGALDRHRKKNCETPKSSESRFDGSPLARVNPRVAHGLRDTGRHGTGGYRCAAVARGTSRHGTGGYRCAAVTGRARGIGPVPSPRRRLQGGGQQLRPRGRPLHRMFHSWSPSWRGLRLARRSASSRRASGELASPRCRCGSWAQGAASPPQGECGCIGSWATGRRQRQDAPQREAHDGPPRVQGCGTHNTASNQGTLTLSSS